jgi:hypothetical protein
MPMMVATMINDTYNIQYECCSRSALERRGPCTGSTLLSQLL